MDDKEKVSVIKPPDTIKSKVTTGGHGSVDLETLEKAEAVIANMAENYLEWVEEDLTKIQNALDNLDAAKEENRRNLLDGIFQIAHDIKGQGGSFGYDLMTTLGDDICRFTENLKQIGKDEIEVIQLHIDTMKLVIKGRISGDGGPQGGEILKGLHKVVAKITGTP